MTTRITPTDFLVSNRIANTGPTPNAIYDAGAWVSVIYWAIYNGTTKVTDSTESSATRPYDVTINPNSNVVNQDLPSGTGVPYPVASSTTVLKGTNGLLILPLEVNVDYRTAGTSPAFNAVYVYVVLMNPAAKVWSPVADVKQLNNINVGWAFNVDTTATSPLIPSATDLFAVTTGITSPINASVGTTLPSSASPDPAYQILLWRSPVDYNSISYQSAVLQQGTVWGLTALSPTSLGTNTVSVTAGTRLQLFLNMKGFYTPLE